MNLDRLIYTPKTNANFFSSHNYFCQSLNHLRPKNKLETCAKFKFNKTKNPNGNRFGRLRTNEPNKTNGIDQPQQLQSWTFEFPLENGQTGETIPTSSIDSSAYFCVPIAGVVVIVVHRNQFISLSRHNWRPPIACDRHKRALHFRWFDVEEAPPSRLTNRNALKDHFNVWRWRNAVCYKSSFKCLCHHSHSNEFGRKTMPFSEWHFYSILPSLCVALFSFVVIIPSSLRLVNEQQIFPL